MTATYVSMVENIGRPRVLVVGDLILDRYIWGNAERISQEAPVILLRAVEREERLGGAACVATMLSALGAEVTLAGVLGHDGDARHCRALLDAHQINHHCVLDDPTRPTTVKERYMGRAQEKHSQQMLRVDFEERKAIDATLTDRLVRNIEDCVDQVEIVLVSDYDKGLCTPELLRRITGICRQRGTRVLVDPIRGGNYGDRYRGCSAMTPNRLEAEMATGIAIGSVDDAYRAAELLRTELEMEVGLVTLDRDGMALVDATGRQVHFPVRQRQVYDITGAGDMVLAMLGVVLAGGGSFDDAICLANIAGGLEVERVGVATLTRDDIIQDLLHAPADQDRKIVSQGNLIRELFRRRRQGHSIVFTNGCFDILHAGHVQYLREAKQQGDVLVIGMNTDASVRRLGKGSDRPINEESNRACVLAALECVDYVCAFDDETPFGLIKLVRPDVLVKGSDYEPDAVVGKTFVESYGGRLHLAKLVPATSTTQIISKIKAA